MSDLNYFPYTIRNLKTILSDDPTQIIINDKIIIDECTGTNGKQEKTINLADGDLAVGICMHGRNVSEEVKEKYIIGSYQGQFDDLIHSWEEICGDVDEA